MKKLWYSLIFAIQFLTRITLIRDLKAEKIQVKTVLICFPAVGFLIGAVLLGVWQLLNVLHRFNSLTVALLVITAEVIITGALHLDGLADTCDAFFSLQASREKKLAIMKDSRIGVMGATALILTLLLKLVLIQQILDHKLWGALLIYPAIGRWSLVAAMYQSPYLREAGTGHLFSQQADAQTLFLSLAWLLPCLLFKTFYLIFLFTAVALALYRLYVHNKIGGITGDILGSAAVLSEIFFLLGVCIFNT